MVDIQWRVKRTVPFNRDNVGEVVLVIEKDREGWMPGSVIISVGGIICRPTSGTIEEPNPEDGLTPSARKLLDSLRTDFPLSGATPSEALPLLGFESRTTYYRAKLVLLGKGLAREAGGRLYPSDDVPPPDGTPPPGGTPDGTHSQADVPSAPASDGTSVTAYLSGETAMYLLCTIAPTVPAAEDVPPRHPEVTKGQQGGCPNERSSLAALPGTFAPEVVRAVERRKLSRKGD